MDHLIHILKDHSGEFPDGPVVRTLHFHCGGPGFDPWSGNKNPTSREAGQKKKKKNHPGCSVENELEGYLGKQ